jgi:sec-independent protein translocase protein TatA
MFQNLTGWHAVILLVIILLLFGAPKLPALAKSLGQSMKIFKAEVKTDEDKAAENGNDGTASANEHAPNSPSEPKQ